MRTHVQAVAVLSLIAAISARAQTTRKDTIDVSVGSALVDFSKHVPGSTLATSNGRCAETVAPRR
jgi:hypothetical protein